MNFIKETQILLSCVPIGIWWSVYLKTTNCTQGGILGLALGLIRLNQRSNERNKSNEFIKLNNRQITNLNALKARLGVTRKIELAWIDKKTREEHLAYAGHRETYKLIDDDMLMVSGTYGPENQPAVIYIFSQKVLDNLDSLSSSSPSSTKILHEIGHIKRGDGKNLRKWQLWALCLEVSAAVSGFFIGRKFSFDFHLLNGSIMGLNIGLLVGAVLSNALVGLLTLKKEQHTEEMAVRASTPAELSPHMYGDLLGLSCETPYWKLPLTPGQFWRDPNSVNIAKTKKIQKEKLMQSGEWEDDRDWVSPSKKSSTSSDNASSFAR